MRRDGAAGAAGRPDVVVMSVLSTELVSAMTCPSSISMRRRVLAATAWSWVMMMTVVPSRLSSSSRARMDAPVAESRLPVGSSASTAGGAPATARAIATRCRSPPDSWVGPGGGPVRQADPVQGVQRQPPPLAPADAGVQQPVGHVAEHGLVLGEEELLEHEPDA